MRQETRNIRLGIALAALTIFAVFAVPQAQGGGPSSFAAANPLITEDMVQNEFFKNRDLANPGVHEISINGEQGYLITESVAGASLGNASDTNSARQRLKLSGEQRLLNYITNNRANDFTLNISNTTPFYRVLQEGSTVSGSFYVAKKDVTAVPKSGAAAPLSSPAPPLPAHNVSFPYWPSDAVPLLPCTGLECVDFCQFLLLVQRVVYFMMTLAVEVIAPVFFIWGGFLILISGGSEERIGKGKKILTGTVVGILLALGAFLIVNSFLYLLGNDPAKGGISWPTVQCEVKK